MAFIGLALALSATVAATAGPLEMRARIFRELIETGNHDAARAMLAADARRWWEVREGPGQPWSLDPSSLGPWANWDLHFHSQRHVLEWREGPSSVTAIVRETNDYYRLLERQPVINEITYYFSETGDIQGMLVRGIGPRDAGLTNEFLKWARAHDAEEIAALMPDGEIDPSGDRPRRFRRLLNRWRQGTGRPPIP